MQGHSQSGHGEPLYTAEEWKRIERRNHLIDVLGIPTKIFDIEELNQCFAEKWVTEFKKLMELN